MTTLFTEKLVAAIAADDPRAGRNTVTLSELATGTVAVCATAPTVTGDLWDHGVTAEATTYNHHAPEVAYLPIEDAPPVEVALAWPARSPHPRVRAFARFARAYFTRIIDTSTPPLVLTAGTNPDDS